MSEECLNLSKANLPPTRSVATGSIEMALSTVESSLGNSPALRRSHSPSDLSQKKVSSTLSVHTRRLTWNLRMDLWKTIFFYNPGPRGCQLLC